MTGRDDSAFRLGMAERLLARGLEASARGEWREASLFARSAIEAASKSIIACFSSVPRSHEPGALLERALGHDAFPGQLKDEARRLAGEWDAYGMEEHVLLSYGDEVNRIDPWTLVTSGKAGEAIAEATRAVDFASRVRSSVFGPDRER